MMSLCRVRWFYWKLKSDVDEKWRLLLNGTTYECDNNISTSKKWNGLVKKSSSYPEKNFESLMAPYIFFLFSKYKNIKHRYWEGKLKRMLLHKRKFKEQRVDAWNEFVQCVLLWEFKRRMFHYVIS
jgi:hypothetical protein